MSQSDSEFIEEEKATLRCKMCIEQVVTPRNSDGTIAAEHITLKAIEGDINDQWSVSIYGPTTKISISITHPEAIGKLSSGHEYYVDFRPIKNI